MKSKYFKIQELVSKRTYDTYGDGAWKFISEDLIVALDQLREHFGKPITVNNWLWNGDFQQRGLRTNIDRIVKDKTNKNQIYVSQHILGRAVDFNVKGMSSDQVFDEIVKNKDKFPTIKRIESKTKATTWTHVDCANEDEFVIF